MRPPHQPHPRQGRGRDGRQAQVRVNIPPKPFSLKCLDIFQFNFIILYFLCILWKSVVPCQGPWSASVWMSRCDDVFNDDGDDDDDEQVLHLWWECLCLAHSALESWYLPNSLMTSPGWILVKCELRWVRVRKLVIFKISHLQNVISTSTEKAPS